MKKLIDKTPKILVLCFTFSIFNVFAETPNVAKTMPQAMQGSWSSNLKYCGRPDNDSKLMISSNKIEFWETSATVISVVTKYDTTLVTASSSSEGETAIDAYRFRLKNGNKTLIEILSDGTQNIRYRCSN